MDPSEEVLEGEEPSSEEEIITHFNLGTLQTNTGTVPQDLQEQLEQRIDEHEGRGSGLVYRGLMSVDFSFYRLQDMTGGSYVELPSINHSILNIKNDDQFCFFWSVLAFLFPAKDHRSLTSSYKHHIHRLNTVGLTHSLLS